MNQVTPRHQAKVIDSSGLSDPVTYDYQKELSDEATTQIQNVIQEDLGLKDDEHSVAILPGKKVCIFVGKLVEGDEE